MIHLLLLSLLIHHQTYASIDNKNYTLPIVENNIKITLNDLLKKESINKNTISKNSDKIGLNLEAIHLLDNPLYLSELNNSIKNNPKYLYFRKKETSLAQQMVEQQIIYNPEVENYCTVLSDIKNTINQLPDPSSRNNDLYQKNYQQYHDMLSWHSNNLHAIITKKSKKYLNELRDSNANLLQINETIKNKNNVISSEIEILEKTIHQQRLKRLLNQMTNFIEKEQFRKNRKFKKNIRSIVYDLIHDAVDKSNTTTDNFNFSQDLITCIIDKVVDQSEKNTHKKNILQPDVPAEGLFVEKVIKKENTTKNSVPRKKDAELQFLDQKLLHQNLFKELYEKVYSFKKDIIVTNKKQMIFPSEQILSIQNSTKRVESLKNIYESLRQIELVSFYLVEFQKCLNQYSYIHKDSENKNDQTIENFLNIPRIIQEHKQYLDLTEEDIDILHKKIDRVNTIIFQKYGIIDHLALDNKIKEINDKILSLTKSLKIFTNMNDKNLKTTIENYQKAIQAFDNEKTECYNLSSLALITIRLRSLLCFNGAFENKHNNLPLKKINVLNPELLADKIKIIQSAQKCSAIAKTLSTKFNGSSFHFKNFIEEQYKNYNITNDEIDLVIFDTMLTILNIVEDSELNENTIEENLYHYLTRKYPHFSEKTIEKMTITHCLILKALNKVEEKNIQK